MENNTSIELLEDITLITLQDCPADTATLAYLFKAIADEGIDVDMISQIATTKKTFELSFTVSGDDFGKVLDLAGKLRKENPSLKLNVSNGNSKISVSAQWMRNCPGTAAKVLDIVSKVTPDIMMITTSETDISVLVPQSDGDNTLAALEKEFVDCSVERN